MKYLPFVFLFVLLVLASAVMFNSPKVVSAYEYDYFRIHILANSNDTLDQELKYVVKNKLIDFYTPYISSCETKEEAKQIIEENLDVATLLVNKSLEENNITYTAKIEMKQEYFPSRYYETFCLEDGLYDAIIVTLGEGKGDNWWCVVYPPLCFVNKKQNDEQNIVYQSKIWEIIQKFFR